MKELYLAILVSIKSILDAETFFTKALLLAYNETDERIRACDLLNRPLSEFWEPLVNNLGHVKCKLGSYDEAIKFHQ